MRTACYELPAAEEVSIAVIVIIYDVLALGTIIGRTQFLPCQGLTVQVGARANVVCAVTADGRVAMDARGTEGMEAPGEMTFSLLSIVF